MNIFVLHELPYQAATMQCDKHVVKMVLESAQMLCTAHRVQTPEVEYPFQYRKTHFNHPCNKWIRESAANYQWLYDHFMGLCNEYRMRYNKIHLCYKKFVQDTDWLAQAPDVKYEHEGLTPFAIAVGDENRAKLKQLGITDPVESYRWYYLNDKYFNIDMRYEKGRAMPDWLEQGINNLQLKEALG